MTDGLRLAEFTRQQYDQLIDWIPDESFLLLWGGPLYRWPLTAAQLEEQLSSDEVTALLLMKDNEAIGFCELIREQSKAYRLCRVLIGPSSLRGQGLGRRLLQLVIEFAQQQFSANQLALYVFEDNLPAIGCYESLDFTVVSSDQHGETEDGKPRIVFRMELALA